MPIPIPKNIYILTSDCKIKKILISYNINYYIFNLIILDEYFRFHCFNLSRSDKR